MSQGKISGKQREILEYIKDEITGKERIMLNVENKVEDVTQALLTMARGSTRSKEVNELTKQIISESVAEEYASLGITNNINSLYIAKKQGFDCYRRLRSFGIGEHSETRIRSYRCFGRCCGRGYGRCCDRCYGRGF